MGVFATVLAYGVIQSAPKAHAETVSNSPDVISSAHHKTNRADTYYVIPPKNFDPQNASDAELKTFGFPKRPKDSKQLLSWKESMKHAKKFVVPTFTNTNKVNAQYTYTSPNWSGYEQEEYSTHQFDDVESKWTVPSVSSSKSNTDSSAWVGIGGDSSLSSTWKLIQAGTEQDKGSSSTNYYFWHEELSYSAGNPEVKVTSIACRPGDNVLVSVSYSSGDVHYFLEDTTLNTYTQFTVTNKSAYYKGNSAEYIMERPEIGNSYSYLANYDFTSFWGARASYSGSSTMYTPGEWSSNGHILDKLNMNDGNLLTSTGTLYSKDFTNDAFGVTWQGYH
ncbi:G1 family endopeptidase [Pullulanibacillus sp. KACC 23026]|uniref:G1 family glutamic endopeptidase n=1 Tax=Pullulanibacillus sp. KACC 23026 TaxID=3028315 RepID=UPI0023B030B1|nr:G1 family glutamic endopeptidase [Pullulanibacillus sp. KACC 23026]WEG14405.1 G1 family endopeptidase [Pullulanibacillus sp. KACC 23026]